MAIPGRIPEALPIWQPRLPHSPKSQRQQQKQERYQAKLKLELQSSQTQTPLYQHKKHSKNQQGQCVFSNPTETLRSVVQLKQGRDFKIAIMNFVTVFKKRI